MCFWSEFLKMETNINVSRMSKKIYKQRFIFLLYNDLYFWRMNFKIKKYTKIRLQEI